MIEGSTGTGDEGRYFPNITCKRAPTVELSKIIPPVERKIKNCYYIVNIKIIIYGTNNNKI
jgi:2C-methyl-D-erythritol 2,4-cyclodiphosphate synthase